ncbi:MAG: CmcJ/NvfI family oxidoreductase [Novosphingobium sp.]
MPDNRMQAVINYAARTDYRQRYFANDHSKDTVVIDPQAMPLADGRAAPPQLDAEGFCLVSHRSAVTNFEDPAEVAAIYPAEVVALLRAQTGADEVIVTAPGILRFSESSGRAGSRDNSMPARFAHVDSTSQTGEGFARRSLPPGRELGRYAHFNVWRAITPPPQDVPLAVCDARSVQGEDLRIADAIFDPPGQPEWSFESWLVAANPAHRWVWFPDMTRDEALIFRTSDLTRGMPVPHVAFDNPAAGPDAPPRASIELRAVAYWYS